MLKVIYLEISFPEKEKNLWRGFFHSSGSCPIDFYDFQPFITWCS